MSYSLKYQNINIRYIYSLVEDINCTHNINYSICKIS